VSKTPTTNRGARSPRRRRAANGRFRGSWNAVELYEVVPEVALEAARIDPGPLKDPADVSTRAWDEARFTVAAKYGRLPPQANEVCRQLRDRDGRSFAWPALLKLVFSETDLKRAHEKRLGAEERAVEEDEVVYSMLLVASWLGVESLTPDSYREGCEKRLKEAGPAERRALEERLLTVGQITHAVGSWDKGLELSGLQTREVREFAQRRAATSTPDAIAAYYAELGHLPTKRQLYEFARAGDFALAKAKGRPWRDWIAVGEARITDLGLPPPPPYGTRNSSDWTAIALPELTAHPRGKYSWSRLDALEAVDRFTASLRPGETPTQHRWRSFSRGQQDVPSWGALRRHGTLVELVQEVSRPDWRDRAAESENARTPTAEDDARLAEARLVKRAMSDCGKAVLQEIAVRGQARPRELAEALGWNIHKLRSYRQALSAAKLIVSVHERHSKQQAYRVTAAGLCALSEATW
jgi:hypothetical protein